METMVLRRLGQAKHTKGQITTVVPSDEGLTLETSASESFNSYSLCTRS